jgi:hypothetical protein
MIEASKNRVDMVTELRDRIELALRTRIADEGTTAAVVEDHAKHVGWRVWRAMRRRPSLGIAVVGGAGLAAAMAIGVGELTIGLVLGYGAYQVLREGVSPGKAAENIIKEMR